MKLLVNQQSHNAIFLTTLLQRRGVAAACHRLLPRAQLQQQRSSMPLPGKKQSLFLEQKRLKPYGHGAAPRRFSSPGLCGNASAFHSYKRNKLVHQKGTCPKR